LREYANICGGTEIIMISYSEKNKMFKLDTPSSSYAMAVLFQEKMLAHLYYGRRLPDCDLTYLLRGEDTSASLTTHRDKVSILDRLPMEYSAGGLGDFRESCLDAENKDGCWGCSLSYVSHRIYTGKDKLLGLPATFADENECDTLELNCADDVLNLEITLVYNVFRNLDVITRHVKIKNNGKETLYLKKVYSACLDIPNDDFEILRLYGSWARERHISRVRLGYGKTSAGSVRGESSHQEHPFFALVNKHTTQDTGSVYGFHLVYSGNFSAAAELSQYNAVRACIGINPYNFSWALELNQVFISPEAVLTYSARGLDGMTNTLHDLYRNHLTRGKYKDAKRPALINSWEAAYFDFDTDKLLNIAGEAAKLGIELFVLDDGWFGKRNDDNTSLGDWTVNEEKIKGGLKYLADEINKLGMKFGIWLEPEMVSPDSELYRAHPDWAVAIPDRSASLCRNQYVLDLTRKEVREYIYESISAVLKSAAISYVKWDMNRPLTDVGSLTLKNQGEFYHRYVLGVYELQERLVSDFPDVLLENCSGGGGRFDPGMLYYSPQIWCSDNTDAIERLIIQEGTAMLYPLSAIGAHVSGCPNHITGRVTPFETRGIVALAGTFGYELDVTKLSDEDKNALPDQIAAYHKYNDLIRRGDYYRLASYAENRRYDCWQVVSKDKTETLISFVNVRAVPNAPKIIVQLKGLDENRDYINDSDGLKYAGGALMYAGLVMDAGCGDYQGALIYFRASTD